MFEYAKHLLQIAEGVHAFATWLIVALGLAALGEVLLKGGDTAVRRALGHFSMATGGMVAGTIIGFGLSLAADFLARLFTREPLGPLHYVTSHAWPWFAWMGVVWLIALGRSWRSHTRSRSDFATFRAPTGILPAYPIPGRGQTPLA